MVDRGTGYAESEAMLAAGAEDWERLEQLLADMTKAELRQLRDAARWLRASIEDELASRRD